MTTNFELNSFLTKFKQMCSAGFKASLHLRSENGNAFVSFEADLGKLAPPCRRRSPAYYRRQNKRREERNACLASEMQTTGEAACKVNANIDAETVEKPLSESDATAVEVEAAEPKPNVNDDIVPAEKAVEENVGEMVAVKAVTDQSQKKAAEKLADRRKWLCLSHGCMGQEFDSYEEVECDCCVKSCQVVEYNSEDDYDDDDLP